MDPDSTVISMSQTPGCCAGMALDGLTVVQFFSTKKFICGNQWGAVWSLLHCCLQASWPRSSPALGTEVSCFLWLVGGILRSRFLGNAHRPWNAEAPILSPHNYHEVWVPDGGELMSRASVRDRNDWLSPLLVPFICTWLVPATSKHRSKRLPIYIYPLSIHCVPSKCQAGF